MPTLGWKGLLSRLWSASWSNPPPRKVVHWSSLPGREGVHLWESVDLSTLASSRSHSMGSWSHSASEWLSHLGMRGLCVRPLSFHHPCDNDEHWYLALLQVGTLRIPQVGRLSLSSELWDNNDRQLEVSRATIDIRIRGNCWGVKIEKEK